MNNLRHVSCASPAMIAAGLAVYAIAIASTGCARPNSPAFQFAELPITYSTVTHLAEAKGCVGEEGLRYLSISLPAGPDVANALKSIAPSAPQAGGIATTPVVTMIAANDQPIVLATTLQSNRQAKLVTFSSTGITQNPATMRSKRVGVTRNTNGDVYFSRLLKKGDLKEEDLRVVSARPADLSALLLQGKIDAAIMWDPFVVQTVRKSSAGPDARTRGEARVLVDPSLHTLAFNIVTTRSKAANNRESLIKILKAAICAETYIRDNRQQAQRDVENWLKLEVGDLDDFFSTTEFKVHLNAPQMATWLGQELEWLRERGQAAVVPADLRPYIDASLLRSVDSSRVTE